MAAGEGAGFTVPLLNSTGRLHYAVPTKEQYDMYYGVFANPVLWFIQHYLWDLGNEPVIDDRIHQAWTDGYVAVNRQIVEKVVAVARARRGCWSWCTTISSHLFRDS
jgi:trehalose 6-phosphate synthase